MVVLICLLCATTAEAAVTPGEPFGRWARVAEVPAPTQDVEVRVEPCPGFHDVLGCTWKGGPVYIDPLSRSVFFHELGHQFDFCCMAGFRVRAKRLMGLSGGWDHLPSERFADRYAECAMGSVVRRIRLCRLIHSAFSHRAST